MNRKHTFTTADLSIKIELCYVNKLCNIDFLVIVVGDLHEHDVQITCFLTDMEDYAVFNEQYVAAFGNHRPSRSCVAVAELPAGFVVEVEAWAYKPA